jgi:SAM-dependent methyltransferase
LTAQIAPETGPWNDQTVSDIAEPTASTRVIGHLLCRLIARFPALWPILSRPVTRFFDARAEGWDSRTRAGSAEHLAPLAAAAGRLDTRPERILDLGCGTGEGTLFLSREYPRASVRGVDISESMIALAREKVGLDPEARIAFRVADAARLPYPDSSFDLICQVNLPLFHRELRRVLRDDGRLVIVSSHGPSTPFHTPHRTVSSVLSRGDLTLLHEGQAGHGSFLVFGRKGGS